MIYYDISCNFFSLHLQIVPYTAVHVFCCSLLCIFGWYEAKVSGDYVCFETFPNKNNVVGKSSFIPSCFSQPDGVICYFMAQMTS